MIYLWILIEVAVILTFAVLGVGWLVRAAWRRVTVRRTRFDSPKT